MDLLIESWAIPITLPKEFDPIMLVPGRMFYVWPLATLAVAFFLLLGILGSLGVCIWSHDGSFSDNLGECLSWASVLVPLIPVVVLVLAAVALGLVRRGRWAVR